MLHMSSVVLAGYIMQNSFCLSPAGAAPNASAWLSVRTPSSTSNDCQLTCDTPDDLAKLSPEQQLLREPPYRIDNAKGQLLGHRTIGTTAVHADGSLEYDAHNLYGLSEAVATHAALQKITGKRPFILTRCTASKACLPLHNI